MTAQIEPFGITAQGQPVQRITLNGGDLTVALLTWGAVVQSVRLAGVAHDLSPGSGRLADYEGPMRHHGSIIGPVVNRLRGARAMIAGQPHQFDANLNGRHTLHSGAFGTHLKVWDLVAASADCATLALDLPDGEGGFPGNRRITAHFALLPPAGLRLTITSTSDAPTIMNVTNHSYWTLDGGPSWAGHRIQVAADSYLLSTDEFLPSGEIAPLAGAALDFRSPVEIAPQAPAFDTCFCLGRDRVALRDVMWLQGRSGLRLTVATTEPGLQLYDGREAVRPGHAAYEGIAIEAQGWPDAPNNPHFPQIDLMPGTPLVQMTEWRFDRPA